ncbi:HDOD domain-containing protein [Pontibacter sp. JAM-7]|uniref:HDOD domain-containing protein n=1 Tax=Pontibacter sp. JAM-7 TaxID=3366581 RepID=UPI003AF8970D
MGQHETDKLQGVKILILDPLGYLRVQCNALEREQGAELYYLKSPDLEEAVALIEQHQITVFLALLGEHPDPELELMEAVMERMPKVVRIVFTSQLTVRQAFFASEVTHHALLDTCAISVLLQAILSSQRLTQMLFKDDILHYMSVLNMQPELPDAYLKLRKRLRREAMRPKAIADLLERDPELTEHLMALVNSAWYGYHREVENPLEAASLLDARTLRDLLLAAHLFAAFPEGDRWRSFRFETLQQRGMLVGKAAQHLCRSVKARSYVQHQAFLAGLLHDLGIQVLAARSPGVYQEIMAEAVSLDQPLYALEKLEFGVTHAEVAAHLLYSWHLPVAVVEAVLFHHFPNASQTSGFSVLMALHISDSLVRSMDNTMGCSLASKLNNAYISREGMDKPLMAWQILIADFQEEVILGMQ